MEERLVELEMKLLFQDEAIRKLTDAVDEQQRQLYQMTKEMELLRAGLSAAEPSSEGSAEEEPPPHY